MKKERLIPAVAYYRMSSDKQEASIPAQRKAVEQYAADHGYKITREYADEGISGDATEKRVQFQKMIADSSKGKFDAVLCWDQDRFGRFDPLEAGYWIKPLRDAGVQLVTVAQGVIDWDSPSGVIVYTVNQSSKNAFLKDLSRNVLRGQKEAAKKGKRIGGLPPYGYRWDGQNLVADPDAADTVRWLFNEYANNDASLRGLCIRLTERGIPSPRSSNGKKSDRQFCWHQSTVRNMLRNPVYVGDMVWNRRHTGKYHCVKSGNVESNGRADTDCRNDQSDWIVTKDAHEAIVDQKTFDRVQKRFARRNKSKRPDSHPFVLSGLLFCSECGERMVGTNYYPKRPKGPTHKYRRYLCSAYKALGKAGCHYNCVGEPQLLRCIVRMLQREFLDPENLEKLRARMKEESKPKRSNGRSLAAQRKRLADIDAKISQAKQRLVEVDADMLDVVQERLRELRSQRVAVEADLTAAERPQGMSADEIDARVDRGINELWSLHERLTKAKPNQLRQVIEELVSRIDLTFEHKNVNKYARSRFSRGQIVLRRDSQLFHDVHNVVANADALRSHDPGGLDVLDADFAAFMRVITSSNHTLKRALTDSKLISGIGNAYSDEILHRARLSPITWTSRLSANELKRLFEATLQTLKEWIARLRDDAGDGFPEKVTAFREGMAVHGRFGLPCPDCGSPIQRIRYAENETNYCARCQTGGKLLADRSLSRLLKGDWPQSIDQLE